MNSNLSIPKVPQLLTDRVYVIQSPAPVGSTRVQIDKKLENSFEVVVLNDNVYLLTGAVVRESNITYYEIYPALVTPVVSTNVLTCLQYATDKNGAVLSTAQNFDIYSKFFILAGQLKDLLKKLGSVSLALPLNNYQIAVKNGFSGTEEQWLQSIKGKDGNSPDPNKYVLKTIFDSTVATLNDKINAIEAGAGAYSPTYGTLTAQDSPLVINWDTDPVPGSNPPITYELKHGDLKRVSVQVTMADSNDSAIIIDYPQAWNIDVATGKILTINNNNKLAYYTIGFGTNGSGTDSDPIIPEFESITPDSNGIIQVDGTMRKAVIDRNVVINGMNLLPGFTGVLLIKQSDDGGFLVTLGANNKGGTPPVNTYPRAITRYYFERYDDITFWKYDVIDPGIQPTLPPTIAIDDQEDTLEVLTQYPDTEVLMQVGISTEWVQYTGKFSFPPQDRPAGFWKFKIKAHEPDRLESKITLSLPTSAIKTGFTLIMPTKLD